MEGRGDDQGTLPGGKRVNYNLGRSRRRARGRLRPGGGNALRDGIEQRHPGWGDCRHHRGEHPLDMEFRLRGLLLLRLLLCITNVRAEFARVLPIERFLEGFRDRGALRERNQHVRPGDRLEHEPLCAGPHDQRRDNGEMDKDGGAAGHPEISIPERRGRQCHFLRITPGKAKGAGDAILRE